MDNTLKKPPPLFKSVRFLLSVLLFFGYCFNYMQKVQMGIAIVCMVNSTALRELSKVNNTSQIYSMNFTRNFSNASSSATYYDAKCGFINNGRNKYDGPFVWPKKAQGVVLSAYFYGYIFTQLPGGWLSFRFGARLILGLSMLIGSVITISLPFLARLSHIALVAGLVINGAAHGAFLPSISSFWTYWAPSSERSRLVGMSSAGIKFGNIVALSLGGFLCVNGFDGGWASIFYVFGLMGVVWSLLLFILSTDSPKTHKFINENERNFILEETRKAIETRKMCQSKVPWREIFTSKPCYALFMGHISHQWGNYLFLTQTPSFLKDVLKFDMKSNGFVSSIPYISSWIMINLSSVLSDKITKMNLISKTNVRRLFVLSSTIFPSMVIVGLSFINCSNVVLGLVLLSFGVGLDAVMNGAGHLVNINEIAGPYTGILFGISNTIASVPGILSPYLASALTPHQTQSEWQIVFIICAVVYLTGGIFYIIFLDSEIQPWAKLEDDTKPINPNKT